MDVGKGNFRSASFVIVHSSCVRCLLRVRSLAGRRKKEGSMVTNLFIMHFRFWFSFWREIGSARNQYLHCSGEIDIPVGFKSLLYL